MGNDETNIEIKPEKKINEGINKNKCNDINVHFNFNGETIIFKSL